MRRLERSKLSLRTWAAIGIGALALLLFIGFFGISRFTSNPYELNATFRTEAQLKPGSVVRIAGVDVGEVKSTEPVSEDSDAVIAKMEIEDTGLPIHADASATVRARLVFEGNFYVDLNPGSPGAPEMETGDTIGVDRTTGPVQLDRVLTDIPASTRTDLRTVFQGLGRSFTEDGNGDGKPASAAFNESLADAPKALAGVAQVTDGLQGVQENDLSNLVRGSSGVLAAMAARDQQLAEMISGFNQTMQATGSRSAELEQSVRLLAPVVEDAEETFVEVERALPNTVQLTRELTPSIQELPATIEASYPWLDIIEPYLGKKQFGGWIRVAQPAIRDTAQAVDRAIPFLQTVNSIARCATVKLLPNNRVVINDPPSPSGPTVIQDAFQSLVGIVSASQNFDGNGRFIRAQTGGGVNPIQSSPLPQQGSMWGNAPLPPLGTRPAYTGAIPPVNFDFNCADGARPDLNSARTGGTP